MGAYVEYDWYNILFMVDTETMYVTNNGFSTVCMRRVVHHMYDVRLM